MRKLKKRAAGIACLVVLIAGGSGALATSSSEHAVDIQGSFYLTDESFPGTPTQCSGSQWMDIKGPQKFIGTIHISDQFSTVYPLLNGKRMVLLVSYLGGDGAEGVLFGKMKVLDTSVAPAALVAKGKLSAATTGGIPSFAGSYFTMLTFFSDGVPTSQRAVITGSMTLGWDPTNGGIIQGGFGTSGNKGVFWDGIPC